MKLNFEQYKFLSFDCYGTLIDWESGILGALHPILNRHGLYREPDELLESYGEFEAMAEAGPYKNYRTILKMVLLNIGQKYGFRPSENEIESFVGSVKDWLPFPDTLEALTKLGSKYKLVILSNIDDALFADSARRLQVDFHDVITAEQVGSYKPSLANFELLLKRLTAPKEQILHVAQSLFHDIKPARKIGLSTIWINRRQGIRGAGATPPAQAQPDVEVPDLSSLTAAIGF